MLHNLKLKIQTHYNIYAGICSADSNFDNLLKNFGTVTPILGRICTLESDFYYMKWIEKSHNLILPSWTIRSWYNLLVSPYAPLTSSIRYIYGYWSRKRPFVDHLRNIRQNVLQVNNLKFCIVFIFHRTSFCYHFSAQVFFCVPHNIDICQEIFAY